MNRKHEAIFMGIGILTGLALSGPVAQAATASLTAAPTSQIFYVNGQRVQFEAYSIHGNNFVKLRDIGKAVDFAVDYDGSTNSVYIYGARPYQEEVTQSTPTPAVPSEETVQAVLRTLRERYPNNTAWPSPYRSTSGGPYGTTVSNCAGWAILCSDAAFGDLPWRRVDSPSWEQIRAGDLVEYRNPQGCHVVVVVSKTDDAMAITDSGTTQKAYWGGDYPRWWLEQRSGLILYTRYSE